MSSVGRLASWTDEVLRVGVDWWMGLVFGF